MIQKTKTGQLAKLGLASALALTLAMKPLTSKQMPLPDPRDPIEIMYEDWENTHAIKTNDNTYTQMNKSLVDQYFARKHRLDFNLNAIEEYAHEFGQFDSTYSNTETLLKLGLAQGEIESNFKQTKQNNELEDIVLTSIADAKGVFQFRTVGLEGANETLKYLQKRDSSYLAIDTFDVALAHEPTPQGAKENIRAGMFMLKAGLENHRGDIDWHVARYNWGTGNLQDAGITHKNFHENKDKLPHETRKYITNMHKKSRTYSDSIEHYKEKQLNSYIAESFAYGLRQAKRRKNTDEVKQEHIGQLLAFSDILIREGKHENNQISKYIARAHYEQAELLHKQNRDEFATAHYKLACEFSPENYWVTKNAAYRVEQLLAQK